MKWSINHSDQQNIAMAIHSALSNAFSNLNQSEPQLVANLVWELPKAINHLALSAGLTVKSDGVFVHGQPFVRCATFPQSTPASVEIGDLLLLRKELNGGHVTDRRALLLQAKKVACFPATPDNANQHHLYAAWPSFEYVRSSSALNGKKRHITGLNMYDAARYLLIGDHACYPPPHPLHSHLFHPIHCCAMTASPTQPNLSHYRCFATELVEFLSGNAGKAFTIPPPKRTRNWDRVIEDLINTTAKRKSVFMGRAGGTSPIARGQGTCMFLSGVQPTAYGFSDPQWTLEDTSASRNRNEGPPRVPGEWPNDFDRDGGISIIEFVVSKDEEK